MNKKTTHDTHQLSIMLLSGILTLFFFQLLTEFVEGIYLFGLLGTDIPPEIALIVLFLAGFLLLLLPKHVSPTVIRLTGSLALVARVMEIFLPTKGRMIVSGLGLCALLLLIPMLLHLAAKTDARNIPAPVSALGFALGLLAHMALRALHSGSDLSAFGMYRLIALGLAAGGLSLLWTPKTPWHTAASTPPTQKTRILGPVLGLFGVLSLSYFAFEAPNILARWIGTSNLIVFEILMLSWFLAGWMIFKNKQPTKPQLLSLSSIFVLSVVFTILPSQVQFPPNSAGAYPLAGPELSSLDKLPFFFMLVLSPILLYLVKIYLEKIITAKPSLGNLGSAFGFGGLLLMLLLLAHVFTTVYDYIPLIGPFFRDKYWLVYSLAALLAVLPAFFLPEHQKLHQWAQKPKSGWLLTAAALCVIALLSLAINQVSPALPEEAPETLRIFTYNIQQGYNDLGERNFEGQIALVRSMDPDILGLQESDTARIAGGNADVVAAFATQLNMYSYYGPSPIPGTFGIALLSKYPIQNPQTYFLYSKGEQVAVIQATITVAGTDFQVFVTHLGNGGPIFQMEQMLELMRGQEHVIAMGDYNFRDYEEQYALATSEFEDATMVALEQIAVESQQGMGQLRFDPAERIDHVFVSPGTQVLLARYFTENESDHPGLFVEIQLGN